MRTLTAGSQKLRVPSDVLTMYRFVFKTSEVQHMMHKMQRNKQSHKSYDMAPTLDNLIEVYDQARNKTARLALEAICRLSRYRLLYILISNKMLSASLFSHMQNVGFLMTRRICRFSVFLFDI